MISWLCEYDGRTGRRRERSCELERKRRAHQTTTPSLSFLTSCRNLATIADGLGMDQDVAGVTLLALGNGSPDVSPGGEESCLRNETDDLLVSFTQVFSTYAAFTASSGSLAIGELLGAAT